MCNFNTKLIATKKKLQHGTIQTIVCVVFKRTDHWCKIPPSSHNDDRIGEKSTRFEHIYHNCGALGSNKCLSRPLWPPNNSSRPRLHKIYFFPYAKKKIDSILSSHYWMINGGKPDVFTKMTNWRRAAASDVPATDGNSKYTLWGFIQWNYISF